MVADHVISVNGVKHSFEAMRDQLREYDRVELVVHKYSLYFPFFVKKLNGSIGLGFGIADLDNKALRRELKINKVDGPANRVNEVMVSE